MKHLQHLATVASYNVSTEASSQIFSDLLTSFIHQIHLYHEKKKPLKSGGSE